MNNTMGWKAECDEWQAIARETQGDVTTAQSRKYRTAHDVSFEQRKRMLARGQHPMTYEEIIAEAENKSHCIHGAPACDECVAHDTMLHMST
jgi:hypothetical protein